MIFEVGAVDGSLAVAAQAPMAAGFEVEFAEEGGGRRREPLTSCWDPQFEKVPPVRKFPSRQGQRHYPGAWRFSSTGGHVGFESWLERDAVMLCVPKTSSTSCDQAIFVDQTTDASLFSDVVLVEIDWLG